MSLSDKVQMLNFMIADYAVKCHLDRQYREAAEKINADKAAEIEKMTGINSAIALKLREAILVETGGDFASYLAKKISPELNALDLADMYLNNTSGDQLFIKLDTKVEVPASISAILKERSGIERAVRDSFAEKAKQTDECLALTEVCNASDFPSINPFNCVHRTFANEVSKVWEGTSEGAMVLSHGIYGSPDSPCVKAVDYIRGRYAGMGETDYYIRFVGDDHSNDFWKVKWVQDGKPIAEFRVA